MNYLSQLISFLILYTLSNSNFQKSLLLSIIIDLYNTNPQQYNNPNIYLGNPNSEYPNCLGNKTINPYKNKASKNINDINTYLENNKSISNIIHKPQPKISTTTFNTYNNLPSNTTNTNLNNFTINPSTNNDNIACNRNIAKNTGNKFNDSPHSPNITKHALDKSINNSNLNSSTFISNKNSLYESSDIYINNKNNITEAPNNINCSTDTNTKKYNKLNYSNNLSTNNTNIIDNHTDNPISNITMDTCTDINSRKSNKFNYSNDITTDNKIIIDNHTDNPINNSTIINTSADINSSKSIKLNYSNDIATDNKIIIDNHTDNPIGMITIDTSTDINSRKSNKLNYSNDITTDNKIIIDNHTDNPINTSPIDISTDINRSNPNKLNCSNDSHTSKNHKNESFTNTSINHKNESNESTSTPKSDKISNKNINHHNSNKGNIDLSNTDTNNKKTNNNDKFIKHIDNNNSISNNKVIIKSEKKAINSNIKNKYIITSSIKQLKESSIIKVSKVKNINSENSFSMNLPKSPINIYKIPFLIGRCTVNDSFNGSLDFSYPINDIIINSNTIIIKENYLLADNFMGVSSALFYFEGYLKTNFCTLEPINSSKKIINSSYKDNIIYTPFTICKYLNIGYLLENEHYLLKNLDIDIIDLTYETSKELRKVNSFNKNSNSYNNCGITISLDYSLNIYTK